jgi:peptidylprolyl isomerase
VLRDLRRVGLVLVAIVGGSFAVAACGSSAPAAAVAGLPKVTGEVGQAAVVTLPPGASAPTHLESAVLVRGNGAVLAGGDAVLANYTLVNWTVAHGVGSAHYVGSTYSTDRGRTPNQPQLVTLGAADNLPAWNQALAGVRVGSRVEIVAPPGSAFGAAGYPKASIGPGDTLVYVVDVVAAYEGNLDIPGKQGAPRDAGLPVVTGDPGSGVPTVTMPAGVKPPARLIARPLIQGSGEKVTAGRTVVARYMGVDWNTGKTIASSFGDGKLAAFPLVSGKVLPGWITGLVGEQVGDRVLVVVPPADGYGPSGRPSAGIGPGDTLVFVFDIVDVLS